MRCQPLPNTGMDAHLGLFLLAAFACLVLGTMVLVANGSRRTRTITTLLLLVLVGAAVAVTPGTPVQAATADCVSGNNSLTITQTSVMDGLAPGVQPVPITGLVVNNGPDGTRVAAIEVEITSVTRQAGTAGHSCDVSDYRLTDPLMIVDRDLGPGGSAPFRGAAIGFSDKATNQDGCKHATVHLRYTTRKPPR